MADWQTEAVEDCLVPLSLGAMTKLQSKDYKASGRYPIIDQGQSIIAGWTDDETGVIASNLPVVVFGDHTRALKYVDFPFVRGADGTQVLKPKSGIDPLYFYYALRAIDLPSRGYNRHFKELKQSRIAIAPDNEQREISQVLRLVEGVRSLQDDVLLTLDRSKRATMRELFTRGLRGEAQKETEIGLVPESWEVSPFDEALQIAQGQVDPKVEPYASMLHIGPENVEPGSGHLLECRTARELGLISGKYEFTPGSIVYSKIRPYLNKVVMPAFRGLCSADMYPLKACEGFEARFLFHYLLSEFFLRQAVPHQLRTGIPKINRDQLASTSVPKTSSPEQAEIVAILDAIDRKIDLHRRKHAVLDELFKALLHKLMNGEISTADLDLSALAEKGAKVAA